MSADINIHYKEFRLATFRRLPQAATSLPSITCQKMANHGFYYYRINHIRCGYCKEIISFNQSINKQTLTKHSAKFCEPIKRRIVCSTYNVLHFKQ